MKSINVVPYDSNWPKMFKEEACFIQDILGVHCLEVYHIGSTSVSGLSAKPDIDVLCIVDQLDQSLVLQENGYLFKGELNIPLRYFYSKNTDYSKVNLHVVEPDHGFSALNLCVRDYLRSHDEARLAYEQLKHQIITDPTSSQIITDYKFPAYTLGKDQFIKKLLQKANYRGLNVNFCMHTREWEAYHQIRNALIFKPRGVIYDRNHPSLSNPKIFHFILYRGAQIIGAATVELLKSDESALRPFAIDTPYQKQGFGSKFLKFLEKWLRQKKQKVIHLHAHKDAAIFYERNGYRLMPFNDYGPGLGSETIDMGKLL